MAMRTELPHPADCEKTQAPPPPPRDEAYLRELREKQFAEQNQCGIPGQAYALRTDAQVLAEFFSYHPPNEVTLPKFQAINQAAKNFAEVVLQNCPAGSDRSGAIHAIRMARMVANAAIALNGLSL